MTGNHNHARNADVSILTAVPDVPEVGNVWGLPTLPEALVGRLDAQAAMFAARMRQGLLAASVAIGLEVLDELFEAEVVELAGPKGRHDAGRTHNRHGTVNGTVTLGGRQVSVSRPRVRTADDTAEASLATYQAAKATDLLAEHMVGAMLAKLSTRRYGAALEPVGDLPAKGTSKSTVSGKFVAATAERLAGLNRRPLDEQRWLIIFIDGFSFGQHLLVGALGVTAEGVKIPLAVVEGTTENATLCTRLTANLRDRGLDASNGLLFVVDGSKALSKAIRAVWGDKALIQRCRLHKERGILDHLPDAEHDWVRRKLRAAWNLTDADAAKRDLEALARALARKHPGAAGALREGLDETLTVTRLGITGALLRTVFSTNPVESMIEIVRDHAANVKRWRDGTMALRWAAAGMEAARTQFRRIKGYRQLPQLAAALEAATADQPDLLDLRVTAS
jgi:putative transposase